MSDVRGAFVAGLLAVLLIVTVVTFDCGQRLWAVRAVVLRGSIFPGSSVSNLAAFGLLCTGVLVSVWIAVLLLIRKFGRRTSGAMLRESRENARIGMPGIEEWVSGADARTSS